MTLDPDDGRLIEVCISSRKCLIASARSEKFADWIGFFRCFLDLLFRYFIIRVFFFFGTKILDFAQSGTEFGSLALKNILDIFFRSLIIHIIYSLLLLV